VRDARQVALRAHALDPRACRFDVALAERVCVRDDVAFTFEPDEDTAALERELELRRVHHLQQRHEMPVGAQVLERALERLVFERVGGDEDERPSREREARVFEGFGEACRAACDDVDRERVEETVEAVVARRGRDVVAHGVVDA
jgi:hypothetical protein